jgi:hypothetical protein
MSLVAEFTFTQVPVSDPKVNASGLRPAFSAGLLNFAAIAVSSMFFLLVRRPGQIDLGGEHARNSTGRTCAM